MPEVFDVDQLLLRYRHAPPPGPGKLVTLAGLTDLDGYNPSNPIPDGRHPFTYVRVEPRHDEFASWSVLFREIDPDRWEMHDDLPMLRLQDAFVALIRGTLVVGGVRILARLRGHVIYEMAFYRGDSPANLAEFARGPHNMKDIRLAELPDGSVGIFTRPQGIVGGKGKIGYTEVSSLDDLNAEVLVQAPLLEAQPLEEQWWGANAVYSLGGHRLGVLGHVARRAAGGLHYYPIAFVFDRRHRRIVQGPDILAERACFPPSPAKRRDLQDVIFPGWIDRERGLLFGGLSDTTIGVIPIEDPFRPR